MDFCKPLNNHTLCYIKLAEREGTVDFCFSDPSCIKAFSIANKNPDVCDSGRDHEQCFKNYAVALNDISACDNVNLKDHCILAALQDPLAKAAHFNTVYDSLVAKTGGTLTKYDYEDLFDGLPGTTDIEFCKNIKGTYISV